VAIAYEALDPFIYGDLRTDLMDPSDAVTINNTGWEVSSRYGVTFHGPVINPQLASSLGPTVRYRGYIPAGHSVEIHRAPREGYATLDGANVAGLLDGGASWKVARHLAFAPGDQVINYTVSSGSGQASLRTRSAWL
jgi:hypothetical protein